MKCEICVQDFEGNSNQLYCSPKCRERQKYLNSRKTKIERSLKNYYTNREEILKKQSAYWSKKYQTDESFRAIRKLRDRTRTILGRNSTLEKDICSKCGINEDLQRHHPSYQSTEHIILCRKCHNTIHQKLKLTQGYTASFSHGR